jgi:hypothetical protein
VTNYSAIDSQKDTRGGLAGGGFGVTPFEMPPAAGRIFDSALEREQWLSRIGLRGIVTGVAHSDMREFSSACDRLVAAFKWARLEGNREAARRWVPIAVACASVGLALGLLLGG